MAGRMLRAANRPAVHIAFELGRRRGGIESAQSFAYYGSTNGPVRIISDTLRVRYHLQARAASTAFRYHFY